MPPRGRSVVPRPKAELTPLEPLQDKDLGAPDEERRAECLMLFVKGYTQTALAEHYGVTRITIQNWLRKAGAEYRTRIQDADHAITEILTTIDLVILEAWKAYSASDIDQLSAPGYLRLVLDGAKEKARYLGLDKPGGDDIAKGKTEVVVSIGGQGVQVGVRT